MKKQILYALTLSACAMVGAGCLSANAQNSSETVQTSKAVGPGAVEEKAENDPSKNAQTDPGTNDNNNNAVAGSDQTADFFLLSSLTANGDGNKMVSKYSLDSVLNVLALGTSDEALQSRILRYTGLNASDDLIAAIKARDASENDAAVKSANGIWVDRAIGLNTSFAEKANGISAGLFDYSDPTEAMNEINAFADKNTDHMIPKVITDPSLIQDMAVVNTLYFNGTWASPFQHESTYEEDFTKADGSTASASFMHEEANAYLETEEWIGYQKAYAEEPYIFVAAMPKDDSKTNFDYSSFDLEELLAAKKDTKVNVSLPKFKFDWSESLDDALKKADLSDLYQSGVFDLMLNNAASLSTIFQKTRVELDEAGTKAAAVTVAIMETAMFEPEQPMELKFNRPFLFAIRNTKTGENLFTGYIGLPVCDS